MKKKILIISGSVLISAVLGVVIVFGNSAMNIEEDHYSYDSERKKQHVNHSDGGFTIPLESLEEEMWFVDAVIYGTVLEQEESYEQNTNITPKIDFNFPVTPSTVMVNEVMYGDIGKDKITFLQHGSILEQIGASKLVNEGEEYILLLMKTTWGDYWPYHDEKGIWKVEEGRVSYVGTDEHLAHLQNLTVEEFSKVVRDAGQNKKKPASVVE
ncbi:hypothetical protein [Bacillus horti]|uniref:hypothetical protein n=1 Tax=Caldalkalibacillus horti TaxID=77523 RepID=UPI0027D87483|nr:hypothetical protein [Bacillus horti]